MPYYKHFFDQFSAANDGVSARRAAERLLALRNQLHRELPPRTVEEKLLLATWNLREFGRNQKYGPRIPESLQYIAEVISRFDLVAVQEVHQNLQDLNRLMSILGEWWNFIVTDVSAGQSGNQERTAFVFDTRKVKFDHLAGEVVLPAVKKRPAAQPVRGPFICSFRAGWRRISVCSVHIYYGSSQPNDPVRVAEIESIAILLAGRNTARQETADGEPDNVILLGDFNVFHQEGDKTTAALERNKFIVPPKIRGLDRDKHYDQIAFHDPRGRLRPTAKAGVFDFAKSIFRNEDCESYQAVMEKFIPGQFAKAKDTKKLYSIWRTFQISDHCPLWLELNIDFAAGYIATRGKLHQERSASSQPARKA